MSSIKKVAEMAEVSTTTVSHVINETRFVSQATKSKVYQAMETLDYTPNLIARSLRSKQSKIIGLIIPIVENSTPFFMEVAQGLESTLKKSNYSLLLGNSNEDLLNEKKQITMFNSQQIDGLVIAPTSNEQHFSKGLISGKIPFVFIDRFPIGTESDYVGSDGETGTFDAIEFLISKGHRSIGFIGEKHLTTGLERFKGYKKALEKNSIDYNPNFTRFDLPTYDSGYKLTQELISQQPDISAIFFATNAIFMGGFSFLQDNHIVIPEDIAIAGFDDYDWTRLTTPPLTVVKQQPFELGVKAAEIILKKINGSSNKTENLRLPTELVLRLSC